MADDLPPIPKKPARGRPPGSTSARANRAPRPAEPVKELPPPVTDSELERRLAELLSSPAFVFKFGIKCDPCANHFRDTGPPTAEALVAYAKTSPVLRRILERVTGVYSTIELAPLLAMYLAFPFVHHGPDGLQPLAPLLGVPPRVKENEPEFSPATAGTARPAAPEPA